MHPETTTKVEDLDAEIAQTQATYQACTTPGQMETVERWHQYLLNRKADELQVQDEFEAILWSAL